VATVGHDTTSYVDSSVSLNDEGDANAEYQVIAVNDAGQSAPSSPATVNIQVTNVTNVKFLLTRLVPNHAPVNPGPKAHPQQVSPALKSVDGYSFWDEVEVFGTNLQNVEWQQKLATQTTGLNEKTGAPEQVGTGLLDNTPDFPKTFVPDVANVNGQQVAQPFLPLRWVRGYKNQTNETKIRVSTDARTGTFAVATYDHHNNPHNSVYQYQAYRLPSPPVSYVELLKHIALFQFDVRFPNPIVGNPGHQETKEFDWSYTWTNGDYQVGPSGPPTLPPDVKFAASPATPAANPGSLLTGTNIDLSAVNYVADFNHH
jgi:hypothetical protein